MKVRTYQVERAVAAVVVGAIAVYRNDWREWVGACAVLLTFCHMQVSDRLAERQAAKSEPDVECHRWLGYYLVAKEVHWVVYFVLLEAWTALAGVPLFLLYPAWRRWWRTHYPLGR
jgi:hypothetical protein